MYTICDEGHCHFKFDRRVRVGGGSHLRFQCTKCGRKYSMAARDWKALVTGKKKHVGPWYQSYLTLVPVK